MARRKKKELPEVNLLELIPERLVEYETAEDGLITILAPRFKSRIMKRLLESRLKNRYLKLKLDEIGSTAWALCDGSTCVRDIGAAMKERFGETVEPCYDRLAMFFTQLEHSGFIRYSNLEEVREKDGS